MSYYDQIAKNWHSATGYHGGSFKKHVLNHTLFEKIATVSNKAILELGAGNGYFMPLVLQHFSGQFPERIVITDLSKQLIKIAQTHFRIPEAEYEQLDVRASFPFEEGSFDLVLATMIFNEVSSGGLTRALKECHRILRSEGLLLITITHPEFIQNLNQQNLIKVEKHGVKTMPGQGGIRLPIVPRQMKDYQRIFAKTGYVWQATDLHLTEEVLNEKPGLRHLGKKPLGLVYECWKLSSTSQETLTNNEADLRARGSFTI